MVEQKPEEAFNSLRDKLPFYIIILFITIGCESSFKNFDDDLINKQIELQDFSEKSIVRKEEILEN
jgi:hypothetical protein